MKIFFEKKRNTFVHDGQSKVPLFWGIGDELLPTVMEDTLLNTWSFQMKLQEERVGPLIGILTSKTKDGDIIGNKELFLNIQHQIQLSGGLSFVYTLDDCQSSYINGTCYIESENKWIQALFPYPNIIYNRMSSRIDESSEKFLHHKNEAMNKGIIIFNPSYIDKFTMYQLFSKNPLLKPLLPKTLLIQDEKNLEQFLDSHPNIYMKPTIRSQGNGIFYIRKESNGAFFYKNAKNEGTFSSFPHLWKYLEKFLNKFPYIAQQDINSAKIDDKKYDYRIICHPINGEYKITGVGIRVAELGGITTNVSKGGSILPYENIRKRSLEKVFQWIVQECGKTLTDEYGFFGEFTLDMGRDQSGKVWIYEVNAKPMKYDEKAIEINRMKRLTQVFYEQTNFI